MYKITVCNLGYENKNLKAIDKQTGDLKTLLEKIKRIHPSSNGRKIEGYKITKVNYNVTEKDFNSKNDNCVNIIETTDFDRCIYISKI